MDSRLPDCPVVSIVGSLSWKPFHITVFVMLIDKQVELSLAYGCADSLSNEKLLEYVHHNRNQNARRINTMGIVKMWISVIKIF